MRSGVVLACLAACRFEHGALVDQGAGDDASVAGDAAPTDTSLDASTPSDAVGAVPRDCLDALTRGLATTSGALSIDPDGPGGSAPFSAYCDMTTAGGGWTLVYAYGFTNYAMFNAADNAATPRPSWPLATTDASLVPVSTAVPQDPGDPGALDFARWAALGANFLVTSNVNHWLRCAPNIGSLVTVTAGAVTCSIVQTVATACTTVVPSDLAWYARGPTLVMAGSGSPHYYYWEASLTNSWPTHDPCGANMQNQLTGIPSPGGAIWLRR